MNNSLTEVLRTNAALEKKLGVTEDEYRGAIILLVRTAQMDTSGSRVAAQVLLSLYNGYSYHIALPDLGALDYAHLDAVLIAIRGRLILLKEPHEIIENGDKVFKVLEDEWKHLRLLNMD